MSKTVVEFDAVGFRNELKKYKKAAEQQVEKLQKQKDTGDKIAYLNNKLSITTFVSMGQAFDTILDLMDDFTTYTKIEDGKENQDNDETGKITT